MLRKWIYGFVIAILFAGGLLISFVFISGTPSYQQCIDDYQNNESYYSNYEKLSSVTDADDVTNSNFNCVIRVIDLHSGLLTAIATIVVSIFTVILAFATIRLTRISKRQEESTRIIERAYVKMSHTPPGIKIDEIKKTFVITMKIENFGNTPANITDVFICPEVVGARKELDDSPSYKWIAETPREISKAFLVRNDYFFQSNLINIPTFDDIMNGAMDMYIVGYVDYIDKFNVRHRGGYARKYIRPEGVQVKGTDDIIKIEGNNLTFVNHAGYNYDRPRKKDEGDD